MGKRFRKGGKAGSSSSGGGDGGGGSLSEEELKVLADKTSFSLENVKDFHEVRNFDSLSCININLKMVIPNSQCFMNDCPDGQMSKEKMKEMFATTVAKSKVTNFVFCLLKSSLKISLKMKCRP